MSATPPEETAAPDPEAPNERPNERIVWRILIPLVLAMALLLGAFIFITYRDQEQRARRNSERSTRQVEELLRTQEEERAAILRTTLQAIMNDDTLAAEFEARDRAAILKREMPLFRDLRKTHAVTHFYFELPDRAVLLRLHQPDLAGDVVNRFTMLQAERTGTTAAGMEHGATGAFTLRVVSPWRKDGRLLGYLELGVEFENIVQSVHTRVSESADFIVAIDKQFLDRGVWERARALRQERDGWNQFSHAVVINKVQGALPAAVHDYLSTPTADQKAASQVTTKTGRTLQLTSLPLTDAGGRKIGRLVVWHDVTSIAEEARASIWRMVAFCLAVGLALIVLFYFLLTRIEGTLAERAAALRSEVAERGRTEVELREAQGRLLDASRRAGMAEVATSVLHNVGNVLNSVNVASSHVADSLRRSKAANLTKVVALLKEHRNDLGTFLTQDAKGQHLPGYLEQLANYLVDEQKLFLKELEGLQKNIEHIKDIVSMQQSYARVSGVVESLRIEDVIEDALRINASGLIRHDVQVVREYAKLPPMNLEKNKVMQILVNLISNAKYACDNAPRKEKHVVVRASNGDGRVRITVRDNGVGIAPENLSRIFEHGFTTKRGGHGFGLHSSALAAKEMKGSLTVASDGVNRGATFTLELPQNAGDNGHG